MNQGEIKQKKSFSTKIIVAVVVVIGIIAVLLIPMIPTSEADFVTEPYSRECTYVVDNYDLEEKFGFLDVYVQSDVTVRNTDSFGGTFAVVHTLRDVDGVFGTETDFFYLGAGESHTSSVTFDTTWGQDTRGSYSVNTPTVTDQHIVTKRKTVYKSIIELILYGETIT